MHMHTKKQGLMEQPEAVGGHATYVDSIILKTDFKTSHESYLSVGSFQDPTKKRSYNGPAM